MKASVIVITLNEVESIASVLQDIPQTEVQEIVVIDGHSTDGTPDLVRGLGYQVITQDGKGYGNAFLTGIKHAKGDVLILMDGDGSQNPKDIPLLLEKIAEGYDVVLGSRYLPTSGSEDDTAIRHFGNKFFTWLTNFLHNMKISDSLFLFTAIRKEVFQKIELQSQSFEFCVEVPIRAHKAGFKFSEVPSFERKRFYGKSRVNVFYHGLRIFWLIIKTKFSR